MLITSIVLAFLVLLRSPASVAKGRELITAYWERESALSRLEQALILGLSSAAAAAMAWSIVVYWLEGSNADARPLLVLHGGPGLGSRYLRAPLTATLGDHRVLVFYDQRGSGYSEGADAPDELTIDRFVADVDAVRAAAGVASIDILGHSFGGLLALHYALAHPDRVGHLVLVDPDPPSRPLWETYRQRLETRTAPEDAATMASIALINFNNYLNLIYNYGS